MLEGVGVGDSIGEKLEAIEGHPLEPKDGQSTSTLRPLAFARISQSSRISRFF